MTVTIALAGKGGTGKTTVAAMVVRYLLEEQQGAVLAIDADPSSNLNMVLGMDLEETVGDIREDMLTEIRSTVGAGALAGGLSSGMSKTDYFDYHIRMATVEGDGVDLIAMGRPEGQGCYCAANSVLRTVMDRIGANYEFVVMDNEAGYGTPQPPHHSRCGCFADCFGPYPARHRRGPAGGRTGG